MKIFFSFIFLLICQNAFSFKLNCTAYVPACEGDIHESDLSVCQQAVAKGIPFEVHDDVITDDGYVITMHRLPRNDSTKRYPVLLMHGLMHSSDVWLMNERNVSLAWILWDQVKINKTKNTE